MFSPTVTWWFSWVVLLAIVGSAVTHFLLRYRRETEYAWVLLPLFVLHRFFTRLLWRTSISGPLPIPPGQGAIIICNHSTSVDPAFIQLGIQRVVHWMVAREYSLDPKLAWIFRLLGTIPVNRDGVDTAATKATIRLAREGQPVGLLPEGRINMTDELLLPGRPGVALIALRARVPVVPCYVRGAPYDGSAFGCFLIPAKVHVEVGQPLDLSEFYRRRHEDGILEELTLYLMREIAKLAGEPDYQPSLATGRRWTDFNQEDWDRARRRMA